MAKGDEIPNEKFHIAITHESDEALVISFTPRLREEMNESKNWRKFDDGNLEQIKKELSELGKFEKFKGMIKDILKEE